MKYFVTGGTGFIGNRLVKQLVDAGHEVVAIARNPAKAVALRSMGVDLWAGDITDRESMRVPMTGVDGVFHVAAWNKVGVRDKSQAYSVNVDGTRNVLGLMKELGIRKGVYTSTLTVFSDTHGELADESYSFSGDHLSVYDRTKSIAHYHVAEPMISGGLPLVIVLPGQVYGPGDTSSLRDTLVRFFKHQLPMLPVGTELTWAHVDDVARAHVLAMEKGTPGQTYIIAGPRHSIIEAMEMVSQISGMPAPRIHVSPRVMKAMAGTMGVLEKVVPVPGQFTEEFLRVNAGVTYIGDNAKARRELGYSPRPLTEGLTETLRSEMSLLGLRRVQSQEVRPPVSPRGKLP
jgi:nucleoside-diphosphate-sugar epimerase